MLSVNIFIKAIMGESCEPRVDFIAEFTLKSLRLKPDKWARLMVSDEQRNFVTSFIERGKTLCLKN